MKLGTNSANILIVDDDRLSRRLLASSLAQQGYQVTEAENGRQALNLLANQSFDTVLLDLVMPETSGLEVLRTIKSKDTLRHLPVIIVSGMDDVELLVECIQEGAADYLLKPVNPTVLKARLDSSLSSKRFFDLERFIQKELVRQKVLFESLFLFSQQITRSPSLEKTGRNILQAIAALTGASQGGFVLRNGDRDTLFRLSSSGEIDFRPIGNVARIPQAALFSPLLEKEKTEIHSDNDCLIYWSEEPSDVNACRSLLASPVLYGSLNVGALVLTHEDKGHFDDHHQSALQTAVGEAALAVINAILYERQRQSADFQKTLYELLSVISSKLDRQAIMTSAVNLIGQITSWPTVSIFRLDDSGQNLILQAIHEPDTLPDRFTFPIAGSVSERALNLGKTQIVNDSEEYSADVRQRDVLFQNAVFTPIIAAGEAAGVLVISSQEPETFVSEDVNLIEALANAIALVLENARLYEKEKERVQELKQFNEELDTFAGAVAHDLKNPLTAVIGFGELITRMSTDERTTRMGQRVTATGMKMNVIINELLLLSRVRKVDVKSEPNDVRLIAEEALERLILMQEEYGATIQWQDDSWPWAMGHGPWIEEIWVNYLSNAMKYGGRPPQIILGADKVNQDQISYWVRDNGSGISPEDQARLFSQFERLDQVKIEGHGLGLSIVKRITEKLGGEVGVDSQMGQGSTFYFTLPAE